MIYNIVGVIWVILGLLWLIKPEVLKNRLKRKMNRRMKWIVYGFVLVFSFILIGSVIRAQGLFLKIIGIIGIVVTLINLIK